ncbi:MAG: hypothetical protein Q9197_004240 [Variospora fuerteventurae]
MAKLSFLYNMNCAFEEQRWIRMASKFFDQTGKRIEPEWLRDKLQNYKVLQDPWIEKNVRHHFRQQQAQPHRALSKGTTRDGEKRNTTGSYARD